MQKQIIITIEESLEINSFRVMVSRNGLTFYEIITALEVAKAHVMEDSSEKARRITDNYIFAKEQSESAKKMIEDSMKEKPEQP